MKKLSIVIFTAVPATGLPHYSRRKRPRGLILGRSGEIERQEKQQQCESKPKNAHLVALLNNLRELIGGIPQLENGSGVEELVAVQPDCVTENLDLVVEVCCNRSGVNSL